MNIGLNKKKNKAINLIEDLKQTWSNSEKLDVIKVKKKVNQKSLNEVEFLDREGTKNNKKEIITKSPFNPVRDKFPKPPAPDFYLGQGLNFYNKGEYKKAINCFQIVLDVEPNHSECTEQLSKAKAKLHETLNSTDSVNSDEKEINSKPEALSIISEAPMVTNNIPINLIEMLSEKEFEAKKDFIRSFNFQEKFEVLAQAIDQSSEGISVASLEGDLIFVNSAFANMHGYEQDLLIGKPVNTFQSNDRIQMVKEAESQIQKDGEYQGEEWHKRSDGSIFPTVTHKSLLRHEDGTPIGILGTHRDITKLKKSEEEIKKLSSAVKQSIDGVAIYDLESKIVYANESFAKMHGYSIEFLMGMKVDELHHDDQKNILKKMMNQVIKDGSWEGEIKRIKQDTSVFPSFISATLLTNMFGEPTGVLTITRDITVRKRMEKKIKRYTVHLEDEVKKRTIELFQSEKLSSLGQLVAGIAQEINNPLGYLTSNSELIDEYIESLKSSTKNKKIIEKLETINDLTKTNLKGINRIIKTTRSLERFALPYKSEKNPIEINKCLKDTIHILSNIVKNRVKIHESFGLIPNLIGNHAQLNQIFMNIILNATEAMDKGNIWIKSTFVNNQIKIEIKDDGKGIPENIVDRVFDPFFTTKKVGKGMGLSVSYRIIQQYSGKISIKSKVGNGTKVTIRIPMVTNNE